MYKPVAGVPKENPAPSVGAVVAACPSKGVAVVEEPKGKPPVLEGVAIKIKYLLINEQHNAS